jgi:hypothetical protein
MVKGRCFRQGGKQNLISRKKSSPRHLAQGMRAWHGALEDRASGNDPMFVVLRWHQFGSFGCDGAQIPIG